ncbi:IclR family transcriptional regulator [Nocardia yamanashiensis]|uniref:IclR family transcriptional regulator n=1 Tax=Nocardia yamanashiensis TaxID=209247 RepID=UPI000833099A|nr:IclR family transcriptional regulator [Nocardia yamanashiensis]UGT43519.1 IclR family transcriptional regulator [Nocardia yamanashiensis]
MKPTDEPRSGTRAVDRAIQVLNCFEGDDPELSLVELAARAGLPVSTTHRLAQALVRGGLLEQDPATDRYRIGHGLASLARPALTRLGLDSAAPHLYALAAGIKITVSVSVAEDRDAVTVFQARPPVFFCPNQVPRARQPLRASAVGHALLAFSPGRAIAEGHAAQWDSKPALPHVELDRVRRTGFASELIDTEDPIRAIAVPIVGPDRRVRGALGVQARSARLDDSLVRSIVPAMRVAAGRIAPLFQTAGGPMLSVAELESR